MNIISIQIDIVKSNECWIQKGSFPRDVLIAWLVCLCVCVWWFCPMLLWKFWVFWSFPSFRLKFSDCIHPIPLKNASYNSIVEWFSRLGTRISWGALCFTYSKGTFFEDGFYQRFSSRIFRANDLFVVFTIHLYRLVNYFLEASFSLFFVSYCILEF